MKTTLRSTVTIVTLAFAIASQAGEKVVVIAIGKPISREAQEVLAKFKKCGFEHEIHAAYGGGTSTSTSTRSYRSPSTQDFVQVTTANDEVIRLYWQPAPDSEAAYWKTEFQEAARISITTGTMQVSAPTPNKNQQNKAEMATPRKPSD